MLRQHRLPAASALWQGAAPRRFTAHRSSATTPRFFHFAAQRASVQVVPFLGAQNFLARDPQRGVEGDDKTQKTTSHRACLLLPAPHAASPARAAMSSAPEARASSLTAQLGGGRPRSRGTLDGEASPAAFETAPAALAASAARQAASYRLRHSASVASLEDAACAAWPEPGAADEQEEPAGGGHTRAGDAASAAPQRGVLRRYLSAPLVPVVAQLRARKLERCQHGSSSALLLMLGAAAAPDAPLSPASPSPMRAECDAMDVSQSPPEEGCVARGAARPRQAPGLMSTSSERLPRRAAAPRCCATQLAAAPPRRSAK
jgi:hypothetical protein